MLAPSPAVLRMQGRARSEQSTLRTDVVADAQVWRNDGEALHDNDFVVMKRSYSLPVKVLPNTSTALRASAKPSFKIQLPSLDIFTLANTFIPHRRSLEPSARKSLPPPAAEKVSDSSSVNDHAVTHVKFIPTITPLDEKTADYHIMSFEASEQISLLPKPTATASQATTGPISERSQTTKEPTELTASSSAPVTSDDTGLSSLLGPSSSPNPDAGGAAARWADEVMDVISETFLG